MARYLFGDVVLDTDRDLLERSGTPLAAQPEGSTARSHNRRGRGTRALDRAGHPILLATPPTRSVDGGDHVQVEVTIGGVGVGEGHGFVQLDAEAGLA